MGTDNQIQIQKDPEKAISNSLRISNAEREKVITRLQTAFTEGRLNDAELDDRVMRAFNAKTVADLDPIISDLPEETIPAMSKPASGRRKFIIGYGSRIERKGRWQVAPKINPVIFKGHMILDLRAAEMSRETAINVFAYKGTLEIIVLPGVRIETHGTVYKGEWINELEDEQELPGARIIHIHGTAYKSKVIIRHAH